MSRPSPPDAEFPVLVVGAGPAGLSLAMELARRGVRALVVERRAAPSDMPRATGISARTMEILRAWDLEPAVREGAPEVEWLAWRGPTLLAAAEGAGPPLGLPTREQLRLLTPAAPACVAQQQVERLLESGLHASEVAQVERGVALADLAVEPDAVHATLRAAGGDERRVRAAFLVGADGTRSTVRAALGIGTRGPGHVAHRLAIQFRAPELWRALGPRRHVVYEVGQPEPAWLIPAGADDRWVYVREWDPAGDDLETWTPDEVARWLRAATGLPRLVPRIDHIGVVFYAARVAERFRAGRALLAGDAAHQATPRGGTGLNAAVQDGFDLGWRLAWVLRGWASEDLLDGYEAERRPLVADTVIDSAEEDRSWLDAGRVLLADLGGRIPHVWLPGTEVRVSTLDLLGADLTLFTGPDREPWDAAVAAVAAPVPVQVRALDAITARMLGIRDGGALLARPDGIAVGSWPPGIDAREALDTAVTLATGRALQPA